MTQKTKQKIVYFVVGVDLESGTKHIDDDLLMDRFGAGQTLDLETMEWEKESESEYQAALAILNNSEWAGE